MVKPKLPRYLRTKLLADGSRAYYWQPPNWARPDAVRNGKKCPVQATPLGRDLVAAIPNAEALNDTLDGWRTGQSGAVNEPGTINWLFAYYRNMKFFTDKAAKTRADYRRMMDLVANLPMKAGTLGSRLASAVDGKAADTVYEKILPRGERTARYAMQVCRLVWSQAVRHGNDTGVTQNPFQGMRVRSTPKSINRPTSREEYNLYRRFAHELGRPEFAAAAALCFELCQRVSTVFDYPTQDQVQRGIYWPDYKPGKSISLRQNKTDVTLQIPLVTKEPDGSIVSLYPELEHELANLPRGEGNIIVNPATGKPYTERRVSTVHRAICQKAGLPKSITFTGFRHGGLTEIGDAGETDVRAISGHKQIATTLIYNKVSAAKARRIAEVRRKHIAELGEAEADDVS